MLEVLKSSIWMSGCHPETTVSNRKFFGMQEIVVGCAKQGQEEE